MALQINCKMPLLCTRRAQGKLRWPGMEEGRRGSNVQRSPPRPPFAESPPRWRLEAFHRGLLREQDVG